MVGTDQEDQIPLTKCKQNTIIYLRYWWSFYWDWHLLAPGVSVVNLFAKENARTNTHATSRNLAVTTKPSRSSIHAGSTGTSSTDSTFGHAWPNLAIGCFTSFRANSISVGSPTDTPTDCIAAYSTITLFTTGWSVATDAGAWRWNGWD